MIDFLYTMMCHFLPAALLILFEILLINAMSKNAKRKNMVNGSEQMKKKNNREKRLTQTTILDVASGSGLLLRSWQKWKEHIC
jgi:hypothetical protein